MPDVHYINPRPGVPVAKLAVAAPRIGSDLQLAPADGREAQGTVTAQGDAKITIEGQGGDPVRVYDCFLVCPAHGSCGHYLVSRVQRERDGGWLATALYLSGRVAEVRDIASMANGRCHVSFRAGGDSATGS